MQKQTDKKTMRIIAGCMFCVASLLWICGYLKEILYATNTIALFESLFCASTAIAFIFSAVALFSNRRVFGAIGCGIAVLPAAYNGISISFPLPNSSMLIVALSLIISFFLLYLFLFNILSFVFLGLSFLLKKANIGMGITSATFSSILACIYIFLELPSAWLGIFCGLAFLFMAPGAILASICFAAPRKPTAPLPSPAPYHDCY